MDEDYKKLLEKQQYRFVGEHSACKICLWTKNSIRGKGVCYKEKFYGIKSHQCCQMSVSVNFCPLDCVFCWRERHNEPYSIIDDPDNVIDNSILEQRKLLAGFGGSDSIDEHKFIEAQNPTNFAISLTGETFSYPKISELIQKLHLRNFSTFVVSNGMYPKVMEKMEMPTQLYVSLSSSDEEMFKRINGDLSGGWDKLMKSMDILKKLKEKTRTVIRLTLVKGLNMDNIDSYASIILRAMPTFIEAKAYMFVGASRERLDKTNMPLHDDIVDFSKKLGAKIGYKIIDKQKESRVVLLMKEDFLGRVMKFD